VTEQQQSEHEADMKEEQSAAMTHEPKRQKQNNMAAMICQPAAVTADVATTITQPIITDQQQHKICTECKQSLPTHLFPKQKFVKEKDNDGTLKILICRQCRKNQTAKRCKQQPKPNTKQGRKSESGIIRRPNNFGYCDYVDKLFSLNCFPDIVSLKVRMVLTHHTTQLHIVNHTHNTHFSLSNRCLHQQKMFQNQWQQSKLQVSMDSSHHESSRKVTTITKRTATAAVLG